MKGLTQNRPLSLIVYISENKIVKKIVLFLSVFLLISASNTKKPVFYFFHSESCPHCVHAEPFIKSLEKKYPEIKFEKLEVSRNFDNKELLIKKIQEFKIESPGVPLFIFGKSYVMGYKKETHDEKIIQMIRKELYPKEMELPKD